MSYATYKKNRKKQLDKILNAVDKYSNNKTYEDNSDEYWKFTTDKAGNGAAIIRFLPPKDGEDVPFVRIFKHFFQGPTGQWYIENSLTTIGQQDPIAEYNSKLWATEVKENQELVRRRKRRLTYTSNILVVNDQQHPENNGKVFKFEYGQKIYEKITDAMKSDFEGDDVLDPFDMIEGANFRLRAKTVDGYRSYDSSMFEPAKPISDDDEELERIYNSLYSLEELIAADKFKTYEQLQQRLNLVLGLNTATDDLPEASPITSQVAESRTLPQEAPEAEPETASDYSSSDLDDDDEEFMKAIREIDDEIPF